MVVKKASRQARAPPRKKAVQLSKINGVIPQAVKTNRKNKKTQIIAQEIKFARLLANSDKRVRDKVLKNLKKWLTVRSKSSFAFTEADFMRLWKGLFYCMWMSDKPLTQEELAESLSSIVHCFDSADVILLYTKCALKSLAKEWFGIDQYRIDKFAMLVRRIVRQTFQRCKQKCWDSDLMVHVAEIIEGLLTDKAVAAGFDMHIVEILWEELAKISGGKVPEDVITVLIKPFVIYLTQMVDERQIKHVMKHIFRYLIFQSDVGIDYSYKFEAWRQAGFPCGTIDAMEKIVVSDEENESDTFEEEEISEPKSEDKKPLDPRAGRVDVELPQLPFDAQQISDLLREHRFHSTSTTKSRRQLIHLAEEFKELAQGKMPLGVKEIRVPVKRSAATNPKQAALRLLEFEEELHSDTNKRKRKKQKTNTNEISLNSKSDEDEDNEMEKEDASVPTSSKKGKLNNVLRQTTSFNQKDCTGKDSSSIKINQIIKPKIYKTDKMKSITPTRLKKPKNRSSGSWDISENITTPPSSPSLNKNVVNAVDEKSVQTDTLQDKKDLLNKNIPWLTPVLRKLDAKDVKAINTSKDNSNETTPKSHSKKRVKIVLQRNTAQHTSEYIQQIRKSPAIPFDANKKPTAGVLKASPIPSPVNPFYNRSYT